MMRKTLKLLLLASATLLIACGQQGPLYFPEDVAAEDAAVQKAETEQGTPPQAASQP